MKVYVDGSYNQSKNIGGYGMVIVDNENNPVPMHGTIQDPAMLEMWQVGGELTATIKAVDMAIRAGEEVIEIWYDYQGIEDWALGKWKAKKTYTQKYVKIMQEAAKKIKIIFHKVKSHSKNKFNDMADKEAKKGCGILPDDNITTLQTSGETKPESFIISKISDNEFQFGRYGDIPTNYQLDDDSIREALEKPAKKLTALELIALAILKNQ